MDQKDKQLVGQLAPGEEEGGHSPCGTARARGGAFHYPPIQCCSESVADGCDLVVADARR